ncbi:MAG: acetate--CoA ligase family protein [Proteobacteria bacterium]|nr:acetate--CoA ligase family protein [Pseudomonadota bacterium]
MLARRNAVYRHADLVRLLNPQSVAVIGASTRAGSFGERVLNNLKKFGGRYYPVNARYEKIGDLTCYPSVAALPEVPDCAVITTPREAVEEIVRECAAAGVGGAIVFASGYAEVGKQDRIEEQARLAEIARSTGLRIVGPNCIGVVNADLGAELTFMSITPIDKPRPRAIGLISQSGALGMTLAQACVRGVSFTHVFTSGNSCDVDMADYVSFLVDEPGCAAIACVFEGMAEPQRLLLAAEMAWKANKPLVVFKMATGEQGAAAAMSHTGSLAGSEAAYRAAFRRAGAILVDDYESLIETAAFFAKAPPMTAPGVAVLATSGGAAIMAADRAEQFGVPLPQPDEGVRAILESHIPEFGAARNPCDVTAQVLAAPGSLQACAEAFFAHPDYAALVVPAAYAIESAAARLPLLSELAAKAGKMTCSLWLSEWRDGPGVKEAEVQSNVALFHSSTSCFQAMAAWWWRTQLRNTAEARAERLSPAKAKAKAAALIRAAGARALTEREAKEVLALYGVPVVGERLTQSAEEATDAAAALGFPVVLKAESPDLPHKTEAGVIKLNLRTADDVCAAFTEIMAKANAVVPRPHVHGVLVQPMVPQGVEMVVGARVDPLFGPLIVVGLGGILVELMKDTALDLAPVGAAQAHALLGQLKGGKLLDGFRNLPNVDRDRLAEIICRVSEFIADQAELVAELDVNPLICNGGRIVAVDALIVPAQRA